MKLLILGFMLLGNAGLGHSWPSVGVFSKDVSPEKLLTIKAALGTESLTAVLDL